MDPNALGSKATLDVQSTVFNSFTELIIEKHICLEHVVRGQEIEGQHDTGKREK